MGKQVKIFLAILSFGITVFPSLSGCLKKGADDPDVSLRTRMARLTGKWKLINYNKTSYVNNGYIYDYHQTDSFDGTTMTHTVTGKNGSTVYTSYTNSNPYSEYLTIQKNGKYMQIVDDGGTLSSVYDKWEWGKADKSIINLYYTVTNFYGYSPYSIYELSNKKMILIDHNSQSSSGHSNSADSKYVYEKQ